MVVGLVALSGEEGEEGDSGMSSPLGITLTDSRDQMVLGPRGVEYTKEKERGRSTTRQEVVMAYGPVALRRSPILTMNLQTMSFASSGVRSRFCPYRLVSKPMTCSGGNCIGVKKCLFPCDSSSACPAEL